MKGLETDLKKVNEVTFFLNISAPEYLKYYRGQIKWVLVDSQCGKKVRFPANLLAEHITHNGIKGLFVLQYLANGKALKLAKIS